jgi:hypothetical protein
VPDQVKELSDNPVVGGEMEMILTVIRDREQDLALASLAAVALAGVGLTQPFPDGSPSRPNVADRGSLEVQCDTVNGPRVRQGFIRAGFDTIERLADPDLPSKQNIVVLRVGPEHQQFLQMVDPAADALCGAGVTVQFGDGKSFAGDPAHDEFVRVQCAQADSAIVQQAFAAVWTALND